VFSVHTLHGASELPILIGPLCFSIASKNDQGKVKKDGREIQGSSLACVRSQECYGSA